MVAFYKASAQWAKIELNTGSWLSSALCSANDWFISVIRIMNSSIEEVEFIESFNVCISNGFLSSCLGFSKTAKTQNNAELDINGA